MKQITESIKQSFNGVTTLTQLNEINTGALSKLRMIQKNGIKLIERSYNKNKGFSKEESDYVFNIYYNFVICDVKLDVVNAVNAVRCKEKVYTHIGMLMLNAKAC